MQGCHHGVQAAVTAEHDDGAGVPMAGECIVELVWRRGRHESDVVVLAQHSQRRVLGLVGGASGVGVGDRENVGHDQDTLDCGGKSPVVRGLSSALCH